MIVVDVVFMCEGNRCNSTEVIEHAGLAVGERAPAIQLPAGWNGVDTGRLLCPKCCEEPVDLPRS